MRSEEQLLVAVRAAVSDLSALLQAIDTAGLRLRPGWRTNLDLQLHTLREVQSVLLAESGAPSRRVWSLGQASIPVLNSLLNGVAKAAGPENGTDDQEMISESNTPDGPGPNGSDSDSPHQDSHDQNNHDPNNTATTLVDRCRDSVAELADALTHLAEGR